MDGKLRVLTGWTVLFSLSALISSAPRGALLSLQPQQGRNQRRHNEPAEWTFCFEHLCRCRDDVADCSQNHGGLTFIPKLPDSVRFVNFSYNNIGNLPAYFFANVTNITSVDVSNNALSLISTHAFKSLKNLTRLYIGGNPELSYKVLDPVFSLPTLETLDINGGNLGPIPSRFFHEHRLPKVQQLNFYGNYLALNDFTNLSALDSLVELDLGYNDIEAMKSQGVLKVQTIKLEKNSVSRFPETCKNESSLYPLLARLILRQNRIDSLATEICLPALEYLDLGQNSISMLLKDGFRHQLFPSLTELYLDSMVTGIVRIETSAFNNPALEVLSLVQNKLDFDLFDVDPEAFHGCLGLETLVLDKNSFLMLDKEICRKMFRTLSHLRRLSLMDVGVASPNTDILSELANLSHLSLARNFISDIPDGAFDDMPNLVSVDLSSNYLTRIRETSFNATTCQKWQHLDLSGNPFTCSCALRWFFTWLREDPGLFSNSTSNYTCYCYFCDDITGDEHTFFLSDQACLFSRDTYAGIVGFATIALLVLLSVLYCLRSRFRVRKMIRRALGGNNHNNDEEQLLDQARYEYDLFVVYAEGDEDWVRGSLMQQLEERRGLRLCIHQRDFHPGRHILDNIESCVEASRRVLVVFSPHFALSEWCQFELTLCQRHVMDRGDYLLVVLLRDVPERDLTPGMMAIMRTYTYLQWSHHPEDRAFFWDNMGLALNA
ncbi:toll-like receptor 2 type-2 [Littorina saxatilis]|uniref:TIR domain-containing protein n=1 Tax=Littorina saxatilis TaxID=31220 RepID=A0AAN9GHB4_9CAEN